jgi:hypothetical protein
MRAYVDASAAAWEKRQMDDLEARVLAAEQKAAYAQHETQKLEELLDAVRVWMNDPNRKITGLRVILEGRDDDDLEKRLGVSRQELHDMVMGAARILQKGVTSRSDTDSLTRLRRYLLGPVADLERRLAHLDVWAMRRVEEDGERTWEITTFERKPGQHWHGRGETLTAALDDLAEWRKRYPDGC